MAGRLATFRSRVLELDPRACCRVREELVRVAELDRHSWCTRGRRHQISFTISSCHPMDILHADPVLLSLDLLEQRAGLAGFHHGRSSTIRFILGSCRYSCFCAGHGRAVASSCRFSRCIMKGLTMRWSERRTAPRPHFKMTSTLPLQATRALVRRRSSCSR
jgi:hypothetical protein